MLPAGLRPSARSQGATWAPALHMCTPVRRRARACLSRSPAIIPAGDCKPSPCTGRRYRRTRTVPRLISMYLSDILIHQITEGARLALNCKRSFR